MIVLELSEDRFGKAMKALTCMSKKLNLLKEIFQEDVVDYRHHDDWEDEEDEEEDKIEHKRRSKRDYRGRYM